MLRAYEGWKFNIFIFISSLHVLEAVLVGQKRVSSGTSPQKGRKVGKEDAPRD